MWAGTGSAGAAGRSTTPSPPPTGGGHAPFSGKSGRESQCSPPRVAVANLPLFDRLRSARDAAEANDVYRRQQFRLQDQEKAEQKELQKKIREVEVRAMQEVVNLRQSLAAAQLDAQEQRRQFLSLREQVERDAKLMRTPQAQQAAIDAAARDAAERCEAALTQLHDELSAQRDAAVAAATADARRDAAAEADARAADARAEADALSQGAENVRAELVSLQETHARAEEAARDQIAALSAEARHLREDAARAAEAHAEELGAAREAAAAAAAAGRDVLATMEATTEAMEAVVEAKLRAFAPGRGG